MALSSAVVVDIAIACGHAGSHRLWHADDAYMAVALLPLIARTTCVSLSFSLNPSHDRDIPTEEEAAAENTTIEKLQHNRTVGLQLLVGTRLNYTLLYESSKTMIDGILSLLSLWCLKAALLSFYSRFVHVMSWGKMAVMALWWLLAVTCIIVVTATLVECRPISLMWKLGPEETRSVCSDGMVYFIAMAVCNIITDIALLVLSFPTLAVARLNLRTKIQLGILFSIGILLITITIVRVPLILNDSMSQKSRSTWATIEILCGCIVANTPFYYGIVRELQHHKGTQSSVTNPSQAGGRFYLQSKGPDQRSYELEPANSLGNNSSRELVISP
ncbi:hypothetical protein FALBO_297 [Fusarium albosuccineum]|uniref:Rhodopsin domain-containing protein n=1 Tax=Fusarium albosuccineum TaxID=1237068 RepID=A0A8H4LRI2_9HYPO|nr:hypothetical protein FALBO_297 [Fusarium albosuccineum]